MAMATSTNGSFLLGSGGYPGAQMLSFSSSSSGHSGNAGLNCGSSDVTSMQEVLARVRGPFTPTQWMELEHQALIYKHIVVNAPVPAGLLLPIRRSLHPPVLPHFSSGGILGSSSLGWGSFQLGYSGSADSEPGRCRRTDGKKWRCSRDAVVDQKYCERHINRGRHRSRKHVEGQTSHAMKATVAIAQPLMGASNGKSSGSHGVSHELTKSLGTNLTDTSPKQFNRMLLDKANRTEDFQDCANQQRKPSILENTKGDNLSEEMSSQEDYAVIPAGALMNTPQSENVNLTPQQQRCKKSQPNLIHHLFGRGIQHDDIQLSISIPVDNSNLSTNHNKAQVTHVVGSSSSEGNVARASWVPDSWETSIGGPLGEFFTNTSNAPDNKSKSRQHPPSLNILADGHTTSPQLQSPTGVLQMTNFSSVPSSTVSSPGSLSAMACSLQAW
ncbi:growth-regulating factor 7-like [Oryza brachyantha]|uniref:Growth-regulating factor n=1 Tax=Oryza brachyantha TaxID=4533 RepID=J3NDG6_ORYBR|nr:growth-regulating factor 7-like [Oryza brachyantha]